MERGTKGERDRGGREGDKYAREMTEMRDDIEGRETWGER